MFDPEDESCEYILKSRILVAIALHVPQTAEALMAVATQTPIHELLPGEVDCQTDIKLWEPAKPFTSQVADFWRRSIGRYHNTGNFVHNNFPQPASFVWTIYTISNCFCRWKRLLN